MTQVDLPLAYLYSHLHGHMLEPSEESLSDVLQVVVAKDEIDFAVQPVKKLCPLSRTSQTEVAEVEYGVIHSYCGIPIGYNRLIHLIHIPERTVAKPDDVRMVEMRVGCEERMFCVKFEIHFSLSFL